MNKERLSNVSEILDGISRFDGFKLYLAHEDDKFKNTKIYQIESDYKYVKLYTKQNQILVTTGFINLPKEDKVDICKKILSNADYIDNNEIVDAIPYTGEDIIKRCKNILDYAKIPFKYKYLVVRRWDNYNFHPNNFNEIIFDDISSLSNHLNYFELMNDERFIEFIKTEIYHTCNDIPDDIGDKLQEAITKINNEEDN